jgi:hypothetical protein
VVPLVEPTTEGRKREPSGVQSQNGLQPSFVASDGIEAARDLVERLRKTEYRNGFAIISIQEVYEAADTIQRLEVLLNLVSQRETWLR